MAESNCASRHHAQVDVRDDPLGVLRASSRTGSACRSSPTAAVLALPAGSWGDDAALPLRGGFLRRGDGNASSSGSARASGNCRAGRGSRSSRKDMSRCIRSGPSRMSWIASRPISAGAVLHGEHVLDLGLEALEDQPAAAVVRRVQQGRTIRLRAWKYACQSSVSSFSCHGTCQTATPGRVTVG